jgi:hypothetical protein
MSNFNSRKRSQAYDAADFIADREGLVGHAKFRFLRILHESGSFRQVSRPRRSGTLILVSLMLALAGFVLDPSSDWSSGLVWTGCLILAVIPVWRFHREERRFLRPDRESDWQAYCQFLRNVVLSDHPGLLDRNLSNSRLESEQPVLRTVPMYRKLLRERGPDLWWSIVLGLWWGMAALLVARLVIAPANWMISFIPPAGGMLAGPAIWTVWRRIIFSIAKSDTRLSGL